MDTTQTPVKVADSTYQNYYINLTSVTNGLTDIYTIGSKLRYVYDTETLYSPNFNGNFTGNLTGNAQTASALNPGRYIWKKFFDGSADISGHIEDTGHIYRLHDSNNYNIGESSYKYYQVFGNFFRGRADGVKSLTYSNQTSKICLLGHDPDIVNVDVDSSDSSKNTGTVYSTRNVYITTDFLLHSPYISCGSNSAFDSNYTFVNYGASKFQNEVLLSTNTANLIVLLAKVGIGTSTPKQKLHVYGGNAIFEGSGAGIVTANSFVKSNGTSTQILLANGTVKKWSDSNTLGAIVARNASGNVYANRYFSNISEETLNSIGSVYVTNSANDTAIRKVSFETFVSAVSGNNIIEIAKNLKVTIAWMDTGITTDSTTFPGGNGSYIVQIDATAVTNSADGSPTIYSGIMTIYDSTNVADESEEIILHRAGKGSTKRLYLRTISTSSGAYKLQIAASNGFANTYNLKFRFKKII